MAHSFTALLIAAYPFLLGVYPILYLYTANPGQATAAQLVGPLALSVAATAAILGVAIWWLRDLRHAALVTTVLLVAFFAYGHVFSAVYLTTVEAPTTSVTQSRYEHALHFVIASALLAFVAVTLNAIANARPQTGKALTVALQVVACALVGQTAVVAVLHGSKVRDVSPPASPVAAPLHAHGLQPDIYHIVLDGYARADVFQMHFAFDNQPFIDRLVASGFDVAPRARTNYFWTYLALPSLLNMAYLEEVTRAMPPQATDVSLLFAVLRDSRVLRFLKARGYTTVHLASTWTGTMTNPAADVLVPCGIGIFQVDFYRALAESTALRAWRSPIANDVARCHLRQFEALEASVDRPGPKYVFAHFIPPHHPYVFDRNGTIVHHATVVDQFQHQLRLWARRDLYVEQARFVNRRVLQAVQAILARAQRPTVIVLHSDHGPQLITADGMKEVDEPFARFSVLAAVRGVGMEDVIPDDIELVNLYRHLFNHYFDAALPTLPGAQFTSPFDRPYVFERVQMRPE